MTESVQQAVLQTLAEDDGAIASSVRFALSHHVDHQAVVGALKSLEGKEMVTSTYVEIEQWQLSAEAKEIAQHGSHEAKVFEAVGEGGVDQEELKKMGDFTKIGIGKAIKEGWIGLKDGRVFRKTDAIEDTVRNQLSRLDQQPSGEGIPLSTLTDLKKRKLISNVVVKDYKITKGPKFSVVISKQATDLTSEMIQSGDYTKENFKPYNFNALGSQPHCGHFHPLLKVREEFRKLFFEMGFVEMPTNAFVESSFWNFDALFQPQQHPARDAHDTFFLSDPECATQFPEDYLETVRKTHETGGWGSLGHRCEWKRSEATKNIMRTHTTAVSARMLYKLAQEKEFRPAKYFSIDRVFRNESLDATHLAEFHQIEGVVADYNMSLADLIGILRLFFQKLGINRLRFKPAFNPYTEPSMEVFGYHEGLHKWIEVGNSGVFRPEMLRPMGLPENVSVLGWGVSLERPTMIKYKFDNIRALSGHKVDMNLVAQNPICRIERDYDM